MRMKAGSMGGCRRLGLLMAAALMLPLGASAREMMHVHEVMDDLAYTNSTGFTMAYRLLKPHEPASGRKYPLVIFLHGAGERGDNNYWQVTQCVPQLVAYMEKHGIEGYLLAPQCPAEPVRRWVEKDWDAYAHRMDAEPSPAMAAVVDLVEGLFANCPIDRDQVLVCGISMGGYGTWELAMRHPDWFAAAMPCCSGGDTTEAWRIRELPVWAFHGEADGVVPVWRSRAMVSALWALNGNIRYREYPGVGHNCWSATYNDEKVLDWFFSQRRRP